MASEVLTNELFATSNLHIFEEIDEIPITWCILSRRLTVSRLAINLREKGRASFLTPPPPP